MISNSPAKLLTLLSHLLVRLHLRPDQDLGLEAVGQTLVQRLLLEPTRRRNGFVILRRLRAVKCKMSSFVKSAAVVCTLKI